MSRQFLRQSLVAIVLLVVVALTVNFGVLPELNKFQERLSQATQVDGLTNIELEQLTRLQELAAVQPAIEDQLDYLRESIPSDIEISKYVDLLDILAERNGIEINFLTIENPTPYSLPETVAAEEVLVPFIDRAGGTLNGIPIEFVVSGGYTNLVSFMGELQQSPRTTLIQGASLNSGSGTKRFSLTLSTLIFSIGTPVAEESTEETETSGETEG